MQGSPLREVGRGFGLRCHHGAVVQPSRIIPGGRQTGWVSDMTVLSGKCLCGQVQISVRGEPLRVGICHCTDCRQESGSAFTFYGVWPARQFQHAGETSDFHGQHFCPRCGSRLFSVDEREAEIKLGTLLDVPTPLVPGYELWIKRREPWLRPIEGAEQYEEDRK